MEMEGDDEVEKIYNVEDLNKCRGCKGVTENEFWVQCEACN